MFTLIGQLPRHLYVFVDSRHTHKEPIGWIPAVWFGLVSFPGRMWGCTVLLESGAVYRNLPPHAIAFTDQPVEEWTPQDAQTWDVYGEAFTCLEYRYLAGLSVKVRANGREHNGEYLFTAAPIGDGFSHYPEQSKEFSFIKLDNGRLTIQPTNHLLFEERSFTINPEIKFPAGLKKQTEVWTVE